MNQASPINAETGAIERLGPLWPSYPSATVEIEYPPFQSPRVCVAGSYQTPLPRELIDVATLLGRVLAAAGFHLITGGSPGVEAIVGDAFSRREALWTVPLMSRRTRLYLVNESPELLDLSTSRITQLGVDSMEELIELSLDRSDVLILIGGSGGTARVGRQALRRRIPVLPLGGTGGDAAMFLDMLPSNSPETMSREAMSILAGDPIEAVVQLPQILRTLVQGIRNLSQKPVLTSTTTVPEARLSKSRSKSASAPKTKPSAKTVVPKKPASKLAAPKKRSLRRRPADKRKKK
jgi:hypothetical protein